MHAQGGNREQVREHDHQIDGMNAHFSFLDAVQKRPDTSTGALIGALSQLRRAFARHGCMV